MDWYFRRYGDLDLQRRMVSDRTRTDAFARAIAEVVQPGQVVLELGTGTGILAMLAARAGARRVHAVEASPMARTAADLCLANGFADRVNVFHLPASALVLEERADVLVSEWLGHFALVEGMLTDLVALRDRFLKPGGTMLPSSVSLHVAPVDDPVLYFRDGPGFWRTPVQGLDFSALEGLELDHGRGLQAHVDPATVLAPPIELASLDLSTARPDDAFGRSTHVFTAHRAGVLSGFVGWFRATLSPGVVLDTGPSSPSTHWAQTYVPFPPREVGEGERLAVDLTLSNDDEEPRVVRLSVRLDDVERTYLLE